MRSTPAPGRRPARANATRRPGPSRLARDRARRTARSPSSSAASLPASAPSPPRAARCRVGRGRRQSHGAPLRRMRRRAPPSVAARTFSRALAASLATVRMRASSRSRARGDGAQARVRRAVEREAHRARAGAREGGRDRHEVLPRHEPIVRNCVPADGARATRSHRSAARRRRRRASRVARTSSRSPRSRPRRRRA